jgi:hypothetical protein
MNDEGARPGPTATNHRESTLAHGHERDEPGRVAIAGAA